MRRSQDSLFSSHWKRTSQFCHRQNVWESRSIRLRARRQAIDTRRTLRTRLATDSRLSLAFSTARCPQQLKLEDPSSFFRRRRVAVRSRLRDKNLRKTERSTPSATKSRFFIPRRFQCSQFSSPQKPLCPPHHRHRVNEIRRNDFLTYGKK